jgi:hypothetical protein
VWATYNHPYWGEYAAVTHNAYKQGSATYIGCFVEADGLKEIIKNVCAIARIKLSPYRFPIIKKSGINSNGQRINYIFNYSGKGQTFTYDGLDGIDLISGTEVRFDSYCAIKPWDLMIIEEGPSGKKESGRQNRAKESSGSDKTVKISNFYSKFATAFSTDHNFKWLGDHMLVVISE